MATNADAPLAIGIDLGTCNSCVAIWQNDRVEIIANAQGNRTTPSYVAFAGDERLVGDAARNQAAANPTNTVYDAKRLIGRKFTDPTVKKDVALWPFGVEADANDKPLVVVEHAGARKTFHAEEISAMLLKRFKDEASAFVGREVQKAVITVPAYFNDAQRQATKDAGQIAGLKVERLVNEPTAAALAYGLDKKKNETIAVYDFGGGTFDISILEVGEGVVEVKSTNGDTHLGGDNIDQRIVEWLLAEFKKDQGIDLGRDPMAVQRLKEAAEKAKIEVSTTVESEINLPFITADASGPKHLNLKLTRAKLESLVDDILQKSIGPCRQALKDAGIDASKIDEVVLVGGQTRMPKIQQIVKDFFGKEPHKGVNPDEVVAIGAALQGGVLAGDVKDLLLLDVTPLSLGVETLGGVMTKLIERNTTIPAKKAETFSTASDGQTSVEIKVLQGEREMATDNKLLGVFSLIGIPPAPRGMPQIEVAFDIDANGILNVHAKDRGTGKEQKITITSSSGMDKGDVEKAVREAEAHRDEDKKRRESIEAKNQLDSIVYATEKLVQENGDKVPASEKAAVEAAIADARKVLETQSTDTEAMKKAAQDVQKASYKIAEALYKTAPPPGGDAPGAPGAAGASGSSSHPSSAKTDDVIDAEVVEEKK